MATTDPFLGPTLAGVVLGVLVVGTVLLVLRVLARAAARDRAGPPLVVDGPAWRLAPPPRSADAEAPYAVRLAKPVVRR